MTRVRRRATHGRAMRERERESDDRWGLAGEMSGWHVSSGRSETLVSGPNPNLKFKNGFQNCA
jgi:hypothetical protein